MKQISEKEFTQDVNNGMTKSQLIEKYQISGENIKKISKELGLQIKRSRKPKFELIRDVVTTITSESLNSLA